MPSLDASMEPVLRKLERLAALDDADRAAFAALPFRLSDHAADTALVREGDVVNECCMLIDGYACRYKETPDGQRQIVSFHLRGDPIDIQHILLPRADHGVATVTPVRAAWVPAAALQALIDARPALGQAIWRTMLVDASVFREWVLNVGAREPVARVAHMLCEFAVRHAAAGLGEAGAFVLPIGSRHIAEATGQTLVVVNRAVQQLVQHGALARRESDIAVADLTRLREIAAFDPDYLHMAA